MLTDLTVVFLFLSFIVLSVGLIGNLFCIRLLSMDKFSNNQSSLLNIIKLMIDSFIQLFSIFELLNYINQEDDLSKTELACKLSHFGLNVLKSQSAWILGLVCLDSFLSSRSVSNKCKNRIYIFFFQALAIYHLIYNFISTGNIKLQFYFDSNSTKCAYSENSAIFKLMDVINSTIMPFLFMLVCSILTILTIFSLKSNCSGIKFSDFISQKTTMTLNILFFILGLPSTVFFFANFFLDIDPKIENFLLVFTNTFAHTGNGILIYVISSFDPAFRIRFKNLLENQSNLESNMN